VRTPFPHPSSSTVLGKGTSVTPRSYTTAEVQLPAEAGGSHQTRHRDLRLFPQLNTFLNRHDQVFAVNLRLIALICGHFTNIIFP
jgi:hypothetical protein